MCVGERLYSSQSEKYSHPKLIGWQFDQPLNFTKQPSEKEMKGYPLFLGSFMSQMSAATLRGFPSNGR